MFVGTKIVYHQDSCRMVGWPAWMGWLVVDAKTFAKEAVDVLGIMPVQGPGCVAHEIQVFF